MYNFAISIIVPIYKAEKYLHRCINSILVQTFSNFEVLLIDDGSPDNSGVLCDEYATKDDRVKVIHKENGGVAAARQCGLDNATGEYVIHADPDDWTDPNMLEALYKKAKEEDADMVICDYYEENRKGSYYISQELKSLNPDTFLRQLLSHQRVGVLWNKLVRRECFSQYNICFNFDIILWEDLYVNCELLRHNIKIAYLPKAYYHYDRIINVNSIIRNRTWNSLNSQIIFCTHFDSILGSEYKQELNLCKKATKERAFVSGLINRKDFAKLYSEINFMFSQQSIFIQLFHPRQLNIYIRVSNSGGYLIARCCYNCMQWVSILKKSLKNCLKY